MDFKTPDLKATKLTVGIMVTYSIIYIYYVFKTLWENADFFLHISLSGISVDALFLCGLIFPLGGIYYLGQTDLPAKNIDGLIDKIMQENISDLLESDKLKLKQIIEIELKRN